MAIEVKFTIPDAETATRISNAFRGNFPVSIDEESPLSDMDWCKLKIREYVKGIVRRYEKKLYEETFSSETTGIFE